MACIDDPELRRVRRALHGGASQPDLAAARAAAVEGVR